MLRRPHADASVGDGSTQCPHACAHAASGCTKVPHPHAHAGDPPASAVDGIAAARRPSASAPHRRANAGHRHTQRPHRNASARDPCANPGKPARECPPSAFRLAARTHQPAGPALRSRPLELEYAETRAPVRRSCASVAVLCMRVGEMHAPTQETGVPLPGTGTQVPGLGAPVRRSRAPVSASGMPYRCTPASPAPTDRSKAIDGAGMFSLAGNRTFTLLPQAAF